MSINLIANQVYNFTNVATEQPCKCEGRAFLRKVNKNDTCQIEFNSTIINSNSEFEQDLDNYEVGKGGAYIDPHQIGGYFTGFGIPNNIVVAWVASPYLALNQYEFSIDNGVTWDNETTLPTLTYTGLVDGTYSCIIRDTLFGTSYYQEIIL